MKNNRILPNGLKGREVEDRIRELMNVKPINESNNNSAVELTKVGPDGLVYGIVREKHEYYIKISSKKNNLITEDFNYIGGLQNKKSEAYPTYANALKHLKLKFNSLAEYLGEGYNIDVFRNDNLLTENFGFTGEGNLDGDKPLSEESLRKMTLGDSVLYKGNTFQITRKNGEVGLIDLGTKSNGGFSFIPLSKIDVDNDLTDINGDRIKISINTNESEVELTEVELAVENMINDQLSGKQDELDVEPDGGDGDIDSKDLAKLRKDNLDEGRFSIMKALSRIGLNETEVKKKV